MQRSSNVRLWKYFAPNKNWLEANSLSSLFNQGLRRNLLKVFYFKPLRDCVSLLDVKMWTSAFGRWLAKYDNSSKEITNVEWFQYGMSWFQFYWWSFLWRISWASVFQFYCYCCGFLHPRFTVIKITRWRAGPFMADRATWICSGRQGEYCLCLYWVGTLTRMRVQGGPSNRPELWRPFIGNGLMQT